MLLIIKRIKINENILKNINSLRLTPFSYKKLNIREIEALISQERVNLKNLLSEKKNLEAVNSSGDFILLWDPPKNIISSDEYNKWKKLKEVASIGINNTISKGIKYQSAVSENTVQLKGYKRILLQKYKVVIGKEVGIVDKEVLKTEYKIGVLQKERVNKILLIRKVKKLFLKKYTTSKRILSPKQNIKYFNINIDIINEVVQSYKRYLIVQDSRQNMDLSNINKLIELLEFYDFNTLNFRLKYVNQNVYNDIRNKLLLEIDSTGVNKIDEDKYFVLAINKIAESLNIDAGNIEELLTNFPKEYSKSFRNILNNFGVDLLILLTMFLEMVMHIVKFI